MGHMRALIKERPGCDGLVLREVDEPAPGPGQVVIAVHVAGICGSDLHIRHGRPPVELRYPVVMGHEFAGVVRAMGPGVASVRPGDPVAAETTFFRCDRCPACRRGAYTLCPERRTIGTYFDGAFASLIAVPEWAVHRLRPDTDLRLAALAEPLAVAAHALVERTRVAAGERVLVTGPGPIGLACLAVARHEGAAVAVAGMPGDEARLACGTRMGADVGGGWADAALARWLDEGVDLLVECSGAATALSRGIGSVRPGGRVVQLGLYGGEIPVNLDQWVLREVTLIPSLSQTHGSWRVAIELLESGALDLGAMITGLYPLDRWADAFQAAEARSGVKVLLIPDDSPLLEGIP
jgi:L-iditol 2-dehydrogenase